MPYYSGSVKARQANLHQFQPLKPCCRSRLTPGGLKWVHYCTCSAVSVVRLESSSSTISQLRRVDMLQRSRGKANTSLSYSHDCTSFESSPSCTPCFQGNPHVYRPLLHSHDCNATRNDLKLIGHLERFEAQPPPLSSGPFL